MRYDLHPACAAWPPMSAAEMDNLVADIKANGLRQPIVLLEGRILDGRCRALACERAGIEPRTEIYEGVDPVGFAISMNMHRRYLDESQRAMVAARLVNIRQGARTDLSQPTATLPEVSQRKAAQMLNVGARTVRYAKTILKSGDVELIGAVERGEKKVFIAAKEIKAAAPRRASNRATPVLDQARAIVRPMVEAERATNSRTLQAEHGISHAHFETAIAAEKARREALKEAPEKMVSIHVLIEKLVPLFERVKEQSKRYIGSISTVELAMIASEGQRLLDAWASDDPSVRRVRGRVVQPKAPAKSEREGANGRSL